MRRKATVLAALALCVSLCTAVGAAEPEETGQLEEGEWKAQPLQQGEITSPPPVELLPVEVIASEDDIAYRLEKIYELGQKKTQPRSLRRALRGKGTNMYSWIS